MSLLPPAPPEPQLAITSSPLSPADAGSMLTLSCVATVIEGLVNQPTITWLNSADTVITDRALLSVSLSQIDNTVTLTFYPLRTSHGDQYICRAVLKITAAGVNIETTESLELNVQSKLSFNNLMKYLILLLFTVREPQVSITGSPFDSGFYIGLELTLTCDIQLDANTVDSGIVVGATWTESGSPVIAEAGRVTISDAVMVSFDPLLFRSTLTFTPLGLADSHSYTCALTVTPQIQAFITGTTASVIKLVQVESKRFLKIACFEKTFHRFSTSEGQNWFHWHLYCWPCVLTVLYCGA